MRVFFALLLLSIAAFAQQPKFEIREGDRVLFLGDVLLEREGNYGFLETLMTQQFADRHFTARNLSWSGESPLGVARASFDAPDKGWERLQQQIAEWKPTVVFLGFGMASSLQELTDRSHDITLNPDTARYGREPMTAARFQDELEQLSAFIAKQGDVRFVYLSPLKHEDLSDYALHRGLPDGKAHNQLLAEYSAAVEKVAAQHHAPFVSLQDLKGAKGGPLTADGIHLQLASYADFAERVGQVLGWTSLPAREDLRAAITRKNLLFFYRFRPSNYTYLFGFRKHEQGQNAKEIPEFDPLIAQAEAQIDTLKRSPQSASPKPAEPAPIVAPGTPVPLPNFDVQPGYKIELWATNPLLEKPIQMNWDSEGRLWVASSSTYPQVNPEDVAATLAGQVAGSKDAPSAGNDRIIVLEDTDHDGKADKSTVFADGLLIPTAVAPFRDAQGHWGCYVGQSTELLRLTDTDGDGKADRREVILSGFGTEDTHHLIHTLKWGPDGRLNFDQSIYIHSHLETPWGMVRLNSGGVMSWDPRTEKVEVHFKGFCNPWGHVWDSAGQEFITDGAGFQGVTWGIQGAMYFTYENGRKICPSISPGSYPKFCSLEYINSPVFPEDWQGSLITCDFRAHRVVHFGVNDLSKAKENPSSGYITQELPDLVRTSDLSFRPIDVRLGPDGALYLADWSNPVINHGEVDFRDPRRDHHQGAFGAVTRVDAPLLTWERLTGQSREALGQLRPAGRAWQTQQATLELAYGPGSDKPDYRKTGTGTLILSTPESPDPRTRLLAMRNTARWPGPNAMDEVLKAALNAPANDPYYEYAAWLSINDLAEPWSQAVLSGAWKLDSPEREKQLEYALNALDPAIGAPVLAKVLEGRPLPADGSGPWIDLIGKAGGPKELRLLLDSLLSQKLNPAASARALAALADATRLRNARPDSDLAPVETLLSHADPQISGQAAQLIGAWKTPHALTLLREASGQGTRTLPPAVRVAAVRGLQDFGGAEAVGILRSLTASEPGSPVARAAAAGLATLDLRASLPQIVAVLNGQQQDADRLELWRAVLAAKGAVGQFTWTLTKGSPKITLEKPTALAALRVARELGRNAAPLVTALTPLAGETLAANAVPANYADIGERVKRDGDPAKGEEIYRRLALACTTCHAIGGAGGKVGPELTSLGASAPLDYIIESVLVPAAKVKEGFHAVSLTMKDGSVAVGIQSRETAQEVFLRNATGQETSVVKANIVGRETIGSIMPAGLTDQLKDREKIDLFAFLAQLGRPGSYDASKGTVARYWAALPGTAQASAQLWPPDGAAPGYTLVDGRLTREQFETTRLFLPPTLENVTLASRFQLPAGGTATLRFTGVSGAAELDGKPATLTAEGVAKVEGLAPGLHTVTVQLPVKAFPPVVRLEVPEGRFIGN